MYTVSYPPQAFSWAAHLQRMSIYASIQQTLSARRCIKRQRALGSEQRGQVPYPKAGRESAEESRGGAWQNVCLCDVGGEGVFSYFIYKSRKASPAKQYEIKALKLVRGWAIFWLQAILGPENKKYKVWGWKPMVHDLPSMWGWRG